jgi:hypothetical protein
VVAAVIRILLASALIAFSPGAAHAGIEVATVSLFSFLATAGAVVQALTPVVTTALVVGASYVAQQILAPSQQAGPAFSSAGRIDPGSAKSTFESSDGPELRAVGRVRLGGLKAFGNTRDEDRFRLILHCKGEIDGFEEFYFSGREIVADIDNDGAVSSYPWAKPGGSWAFVLVKTGSDSETAWSGLISSFPELWTSSHRVRGIVQSLVRFVSPGLTEKKFLTLYQAGVPDLEVVIRAEKNVYDPRISATQWTENGVLNALHILLSYPEFSLSDIDLTYISQQANIADTLVATKAGDATRTRCSGVWSSETPRGDTMQKVLDSIGAWIVPRQNGEKLGIQLISDDPASEATIELRDIVDIVWRSGPEGVERPNLCRVKYYSPERNYDMAEIDLSGIAWARIDDEIEAYGEKPYDVELPFCPNAGQAQRIARRMFALTRADSGIIKTNMAGLGVWGCRVVSIEMPDDIGTIKALIGVPRVLDDEGMVEIPFVVWPTLDEWDVDVHEAAAPDQIPDLAYGAPLETPNTPVNAYVVHYQGGLGSVTRVRYIVPNDADTVEASYRLYTGSNPNPWSGMTEYEAPNGYTHAYVESDLTGETADFRVRTFDSNDNGSAWSGVLNIASIAVNNNAPDAPTISGAWSGSQIQVTVAAANNLNVAYLTLSGGGSPTVNSIRPGERVQWTNSPSASGSTYTATAHSSNGTASSTVSMIAARDAAGAAVVEIRAIHVVGSNTITVSWTASAVDEVAFTGPGAPGTPQSGSSGSWTTTASSGAKNFTAQGYVGGVPSGTTASITITVP